MISRILIGLAGALPLANAIGCYKGGLTFKHLHGDDSNTSNDEVKTDIATSCRMVENRVFTRDTPWDHCTNWTVTKGPTDDTCIWCNLDITTSPEMCAACERSKTHHIDWQIQLRSAEDLEDAGEPAVEEQKLTYDDCVKAFETELGGCTTGSEQNHGNLWYRIDPNWDPCA